MVLAQALATIFGLPKEVSIDREKTLQAAQKYIEKKKYDRAIVEYQRIVQEDPNDARTLLKIGDLQARLSAYPEAIATYDRVGQYYASQGFALKAIAVYKQIRELIKKHAPDLADRYGHIVPKLAEIYTQLGLTSDALAAWDEVATRLQRGGRDRDAIEVFRRMVELDAGNPLPHLRLAEACCRVQALDEAIESFWTAAELLLNLDRAEDALKVIERILHFRTDTRFARVAAELYLQRGGGRDDGMQALAKLQICFQADPRDLDTLALLAQAFTAIGQDGKSIEVYKEMAKIAREQQKGELYAQLLAHLRSVAPADDQVLMLDSVMPAESRASLDSGQENIEDDDLIFLEDTEEDLNPGPKPMVAPPAPLPRFVNAPDAVAVDDQLEAAEELSERSDFDTEAHARKAVVDAESFRKLRLYPKAIEALHIALEIDPRSLDIRQKLREILIEAGEREAAQQETVNVAQLHLEAGDFVQAERYLGLVLDADPEHPGAVLLWEQLGLVQAHSSPKGASIPVQLRGPHDLTGPAPVLDNFDPNAPLPSYDLEEIGAEQALQGDPSPQPRSGSSLTVIDDPFPAAAGYHADAPLPSFPLGVEPDDDDAEVIEELTPYDEAVEISSVEDFDEDAPHTVASAGVAPAGDANFDGLEEVLDEAEFFAARGLLEDARAILLEQLTRTPNHKLVLERLAEVEAAQPSSADSQTKERSQLSEDSDFDITTSLDALDALDPNDSLEPEARGMLNSSQDIDVDQVFAKFKAGVKAQVSDSDSATHYDLGVAYKEMGLLADAINEFEIAGRDAARACNCLAMIGMIYLEQNQLERAAEAYVRALSATDKTVEQEMSIYYDLGNVYEMKEKAQDALYYFQKIARRDPGYRDVAERIRQLQPPTLVAQPAARAVNDADEFDRAFDDLFDKR